MDREAIGFSIGRLSLLLSTLNRRTFATTPRSDSTILGTNDSEALRTGRMKNLLVAQKMKDLSRTTDQPFSPKSVQISAAEYPVYLKKAYKSGKFSKPRNTLGIARDIPDAEMEKLLLASIQINDDDLRQLASQRARAIKDVILGAQKIEQERIFLVEPKSLQPEPKGKLKNSRVDLSLK